MRSIWKGHIRFSLVTIPIQIFNAVETKSEIHFKQLHREDNGPVGYNKVCRSCDKKLSSSDIVKGYEYESDNFVMLEKEDFEKIKLQSNKAIEIEGFIDPAEVHPSRFEAVYYVGPSGEPAQKTYNLFCHTLISTKKAGIGRIILRDREDVVMIVADGMGMIMYKLRFPYELRKMSDVPDLSEGKPEKAELELATTLVDQLVTTFDEINFEDRFRDALMEMVEDKISGKEVVRVEEKEEESPVVDIMSALKGSIERAKKLKKGA